MHTIVKVLGTEERTKDNRRYTRTHAILEDGSEVIGFGSDFAVGDKVMSWYDEQWDVYKMMRPIDKSSPNA